MKFSINTNTAAGNARRHLGINNFHLKNSMTRLSSGQKILQPYEEVKDSHITTETYFCFSIRDHIFNYLVTSNF